MNKKILLLPLSLMLTSCGEEDVFDLCQTDSFRSSGLTICHNDFEIDVNEIDRLVEVLEEEINIHYDISNLPSRFEENNINVVFTDKHMLFDCRETKDGLFICDDYISGATYNGKSVYVNYRNCLPGTSFAHELLHVVEAVYLDDKNRTDHKTPHFFVEGSSPINEAIEITTNSRLKGEFDRCNGTK